MESFIQLLNLVQAVLSWAVGQSKIGIKRFYKNSRAKSKYALYLGDFSAVKNRKIGKKYGTPKLHPGDGLQKKSNSPNTYYYYLSFTQLVSSLIVKMNPNVLAEFKD